jgi:GTP:adenosylcobinamide-phosphate guanylyltransferase
MMLSAFLLAGGRGRRLSQLTSTPKVLIEIQEKPLIRYWVDHLLECCDDVFVSLWWQGDQIAQLLHTWYPHLEKLHCICDGHEGQWAHAPYVVQHNRSDVIAIILADNFCERFDLLKSILTIPSDCASSVGLMPQRFSSIGTPGQLVWNGMAVVRKTLFNKLAATFPNNTIIGDQIIPMLRQQYKPHLFLMPGIVLDIGTSNNINWLRERGYRVNYD